MIPRVVQEIAHAHQRAWLRLDDRTPLMDAHDKAALRRRPLRPQHLEQDRRGGTAGNRPVSGEPQILNATSSECGQRELIFLQVELAGVVTNRNLEG